MISYLLLDDKPFVLYYFDGENYVTYFEKEDDFIPVDVLPEILGQYNISKEMIAIIGQVYDENGDGKLTKVECFGLFIMWTMF